MLLGKWKLNEMHCLDCREGLAGLPDDSVDLAITSPPYWGQRGDEGVGSESDPREYLLNLSAILMETMRVIKPSGLLWLNLGDTYNTPLNWKESDHAYSTLGINRTGLHPNNSAYTKPRGSRRAFISQEEGWLQYGNLLALPYRVAVSLCDNGILFRGEVIWAKRKAIPEGRCRRPHRKHELILIFAKSEQHRFRIEPPVPSVWNLTPDFNKTSHTSTFPIDLPIQCIRCSGIERGVVLDPFMGSGTTALAALKLGMDFIGFELDSKRVEEAKQRINNFLKAPVLADLGS
jgi:DNA modification methylase